MELKWANEDVEEYQAILKRGYDSIDDEFDMIFERDTYEETLEAVKKYNPKLIVLEMSMELSWQQGWQMI